MRAPEVHPLEDTLPNSAPLEVTHSLGYDVTGYEGMGEVGALAVSLSRGYTLSHCHFLCNSRG